MDSPDRERILELFEAHRARPGAAFDEAHFLDFLIPEPERIGAVRNSFNGLRRLNRFIDEVQLEFGVYFSVNDRDANPSVEQFIQRIEKLQQSRQGSLRSLTNQERRGVNWTAILIADVLLAALAVGLYPTWWLVVPVILVALALTGWFLRFVRRERQYLQSLRQKIEASE